MNKKIELQQAHLAFSNMTPEGIKYNSACDAPVRGQVAARYVCERLNYSFWADYRFARSSFTFSEFQRHAG